MITVWISQKRYFANWIPYAEKFTVNDESATDFCEAMKLQLMYTAYKLRNYLARRLKSREKRRCAGLARTNNEASRLIERSFKKFDQDFRGQGRA